MEIDRLRSQNVTLKRGQHSKYLPFAFTEHGILMLSSVLKSERAEKVNILIIDTFVKLRELIYVNKDIVHQLEIVQIKLEDHDNQIRAVFEFLKQLEESKRDEDDFGERKRIGFKTN